MSAVKPVVGIICDWCKDILYAPIIHLSDCHHSVHKKCFEEIAQHALICPTCTAKITEGTENPRIEQLLIKLDMLGRTVLESNRHGCSDGLFDKLLKLLHLAIKKDELDVVKFVIAKFVIAKEKGVSVPALIEGVSPLYVACENGKTEIAKFLLEEGADPAQKNDLGYKAQWDQYWYMNDRISGKRHAATPMQAAARIGNKDLVCLLLEHKAPLDELDSDGHSPAFTATHLGHEDLALFLIEQGANINVKGLDGVSLLRIAVRFKRLKIVQELVKRGVSFSGLDKEKNIPECVREELRKSKEFCSSSLQHKQEGEKTAIALISSSTPETLPGSSVEKSEIVGKVDEAIVKKIIGTEESTALEKKTAEIITLSDGTKELAVLIRQALYQITQATKATKAKGPFLAGAEEAFLLVDLKNKAASEDDSWVPAPNPFYDSISLMKNYFLIDGHGVMFRLVRTLVKECIVGDGLDIRLQIPEYLSGLSSTASV